MAEFFLGLPWLPQPFPLTPFSLSPQPTIEANVEVAHHDVSVTRKVTGSFTQASPSRACAATSALCTRASCLCCVTHKRSITWLHSALRTAKEKRIMRLGGTGKGSRESRSSKKSLTEADSLVIAEVPDAAKPWRLCAPRRRRIVEQRQTQKLWPGVGKGWGWRRVARRRRCGFASVALLKTRCRRLCHPLLSLFCTFKNYFFKNVSDEVTTGNK